jgi:hypothetical protein
LPESLEGLLPTRMNSREAAQEYSPRRKPWVNECKQVSPEAGERQLADF